MSPPRRVASSGPEFHSHRLRRFVNRRFRKASSLLVWRAAITDRRASPQHSISRRWCRKRAAYTRSSASPSTASPSRTTPIGRILDDIGRMAGSAKSRTGACWRARSGSTAGSARTGATTSIMTMASCVTISRLATSRSSASSRMPLMRSRARRANLPHQRRRPHRRRLRHHHHAGGRRGHGSFCGAPAHERRSCPAGFSLNKKVSLTSARLARGPASARRCGAPPWPRS